MSPYRIGIVVFDGIIPFHLSVPCAVFEKAQDPQGAPYFQIEICTAIPGVLRTNSGFSIVVEQPLTILDGMDMVIIPSWNNPDIVPSAELIRAVSSAHQRGAKIVGLCMGTFVVAACGLLNGRKATTHWNWMKDLSRRYPAVSVDRNILYIDEGDIITSAGTAASIDCCLHLVRQQCGAEVASQVARQLVVPPHRQGGQAQYIEQPVYNTQSVDRFAQTLAWATENLNYPLTLDLLAEKSCMSRRTFTRKFRKMTGTSFTRWLLNQRLSLAQRFLEKTDQSVEAIAQNTGLGSAFSLRRHFRQEFSTTPSSYRKEFKLL